MAVVAQCKEGRWTPEIKLTVILVVALDRHFGIATELAGPRCGQHCPGGYSPLKLLELGVTLSPGVPVVPTSGFHVLA
jgi:hypothetical protein